MVLLVLSWICDIAIQGAVVHISEQKENMVICTDGSVLPWACIYRNLYRRRRRKFLVYIPVASFNSTAGLVYYKLRHKKQFQGMV